MRQHSSLFIVAGKSEPLSASQVHEFYHEHQTQVMNFIKTKQEMKYIFFLMLLKTCAIKLSASMHSSVQKLRYANFLYDLQILRERNFY